MKRHDPNQGTIESHVSVGIQPTDNGTNFTPGAARLDSLIDAVVGKRITYKQVTA